MAVDRTKVQYFGLVALVWASAVEFSEAKTKWESRRAEAKAEAQSQPTQSPDEILLNLYPTLVSNRIKLYDCVA